MKMERLKVVKLAKESLEFNNGMLLESYHESDCCEHHWLDFSEISLVDFEGLEFDVTNDSFFTRIEGYGIALNPKNGFPVRVAGYGSNNGYYSDNLNLRLKIKDTGEIIKDYNISECQKWNEFE